LLAFLKKNWFVLGLLAVSGVTLLDGTETVAGIGKWCKAHRGADIVIVLIFLGSGLLLQKEEIRNGVGDVRGTVIAVAIIFAASPVIARLLALAPLDREVQAGLFLVAVMPTTLSSGVVMTGAAGGNIAHALLVSLLTNGLAVFVTPFALALLLNVGGDSTAPLIDKGALAAQIGFLVLAPLFLGLALRPGLRRFEGSLRRAVPVFNSCLVLAVIWMALSEARQTVLGGGHQAMLVVALSFVFHALLLSAAFGASALFGLGPGRREGIVFVGGQKTLPLSILLQIKLFPDYGMTLVFCVVHHFVHLIMDGYLVGWFRAKRQAGRA